MKTGMIAIGTFAAGVGVGYLINPAAPDASANATAASEALPTKGKNERSTEPAERQRLDGLLSQVIERSKRVYPGEEKKDQGPEPTIDAADYPKLLDALQRRAGLSGLSDNDKAAFGKLLGDWFAADPNRATNWVRAIQNAGDRRQLGGVLVATAIKTDYEAAVRLAQDFCVNNDGILVVPEFLMKAAAERGAAELLTLCSLSNGDGSSSGYSPSYAADFDFKAALQGFDELAAKGLKPTTYPANLMDEWAKRDPEAAFRWFVTSESKGFVGGFSSYFSALSRKASADELASKVSLALSIGGTHEGMLNTIAGQLSEPGLGGSNLKLVSETLAKLPDAIDEINFRTALMRTTAWSGKEGSGHRERYLQELEPEERVTMMKAIFEPEDAPQWDQGSIDSLKESLVALGHSAEQVKALVPDAPKQEEGGSGGVVFGVLGGSGFLPSEEEQIEFEDAE